MDASNVPGEYALTILSECAAFPRRLVFFLKGQLEVSFVSFAEPTRLSESSCHATILSELRCAWSTHLRAAEGEPCSLLQKRVMLLTGLQPDVVVQSTILRSKSSAS